MMMHFAAPGLGGRWLVVYCLPWSGVLRTVLDCRDYLIALCEAERLNSQPQHTESPGRV